MGNSPDDGRLPTRQAEDRYPPGPPSKRRRIALACGNCRQRKSRCDGIRPACSLCVEIGVDCVYEQAGVAGNLTVSRSYLDRLERRLADIEADLKEVKARQADGEADAFVDEESVTVAQVEVTSEPAPKAPVERIVNEFGEPDTAEDSIDGMGAIKFTDEQDWGYFGPSSNIAFLRHISLAMARMDDLHQPMPSPTSRAHEAVAGGISISRPHGSGDGPQKVNIHALPSETRTWSLIREYFQKTGRLLPFVHEATFCETYFAMKTSNFTLARRTWLGLLNIILAMAATLHVDTSVSAEKRIAESDIYYQRANGLCDKESRRNISVELVQYLLILGQYLQGTQKSVQAWTVHGLAVTTALQLGLHSPKTNRAFPPLECEIRKRVWHGCILLDRTLSMTFGRPAMIHESYLKLEPPITDMKIVGEELEPVAWSAVAGSDTLMGPQQMDGLYYKATIDLYNVMYRIIDTCFGQNLGLDDVQSDLSMLFSNVLRGEAELDTWREQLTGNQLSVYDEPVSPADFQNVGVDGKILTRYAVVLSVRYHNLQILLHRPVLEKLLETCGRPAATSTSTSINRRRTLQLGLSSIQTCMHSAQTIISLVHTIVLSSGPKRDLLGAWNFSLFYTFNAALAIFAAMHVARFDIQEQLAPSETAQVPEREEGETKRLSAALLKWEFVDTAMPFFGMAIEALENLDRGNAVVERCVSYLSQLVLVPINPDLSNQVQDLSNQVQDGDHPNTAGGQSRQPMSLHQHHRALPNGTAAHRNQQQLPPADIDLNEFMLDTDFDFLNMAWLSS